ncbi:MAG: DNA adenine methylase [Anaerolineae bacterium]|nr:DNA adenine methylase [Anaerolineae bacterium]
MQQLSFLPANTKKVINVASVKHRSPFRYPGGKTWLVPRVRQWLLSLQTRPKVFFEPFAGGAIIGLTVAAEGLAEHVTLVELDEQVAAVWHAIIEGDAEWLANKITTFDLTPETADKVLSLKATTYEELAFQTIIRNRINHGGILAPGAGRIKTGENGKGIQSRWYPETISRRIRKIAAIRDRLTFIEGDGLQILRENATDNKAVYFIDPPYTAAGKRAGARLYNYHELDHKELFNLAGDLQGDFLMTYDNCEGVRRLAEKHNFDMEPIAMKNTHHARMTELLIGRNLDWIRKDIVYGVH